MRAYIFHRHLFFFFVLLYLAAVFHGPRMGRSEFYPFFNWSLFSHTGSIRNAVVLIVDDINGVKLEKPTIYYYLPRQLQARKGVRLSKLLVDIHKALHNNDQTRYRHYVNILREEYFRSMRSATFRIAIIEYNPTERLKTGEFEIKKVLSELST